MADDRPAGAAGLAAGLVRAPAALDWFLGMGRAAVAESAGRENMFVGTRSFWPRHVGDWFALLPLPKSVPPRDGPVWAVCCTAPAWGAPLAWACCTPPSVQRGVVAGIGAPLRAFGALVAAGGESSDEPNTFQSQPTAAAAVILVWTTKTANPKSSGRFLILNRMVQSVTSRA
jgi:hypothetical protein